MKYPKRKKEPRQTMNIGFDNQKYLQMQSEHIRERISMFGDKLYLEFGGKLFTHPACFRAFSRTASCGCCCS